MGSGRAGELRNEELPAAFWDELPAEQSAHPDLLAVNAILEEASPDERAETYKVWFLEEGGVETRPHETVFGPT